MSHSMSHHLLPLVKSLIYVSMPSSQRSPETHLWLHKLGLLTHCNNGEKHFMGNKGSFGKKMLERTYYRIWDCLSDFGKRVKEVRLCFRFNAVRRHVNSMIGILIDLI